MLRKAYELTRSQKLFVFCAAVFITALVVAEATAGKFFTAFDLPAGIVIFGVTFNEVIMTAGRMLWLRATGSTLGSQFIDTFVVLFVAFWGHFSFQEILAITLFNYAYKFIIAVVITPIIYLAHWGMGRYLAHGGKDQSPGGAAAAIAGQHEEGTPGRTAT